MSSVAVSIALQIPFILIGLGIILLIWPYSFRSNLILKIVLGVGLGAGFSSLLFFLWLLILPNYLNFYLIFEIIILLILLLCLINLRKREKPESPDQFNWKKQHWYGWGILSIFILSTALWIFSYRSVTFMSPHGTFDAYAIWNLRARFIVRGGENWQTGLSPDLNWKNHPDYPMLTPALVARSWSFLDNETTRVPIVLSAIFTLGMVGMVFATLLETRGLTTASIGGIVLLSTSWVQFFPTTQNADTPLAFYYLACCSLIYLYYRDPKKQFLFLAGFMAGFAAWTKNEGIVFLLATFGCILLVQWFNSKKLKKSLKSLCPYLLGLILPTIIILVFKTQLATDNDMSNNLTINLAWAQIIDGGRYGIIGKEFLRLFYSVEILDISFVVWILVFLFILGKKDQNIVGNRILMSVVVLTLFGYFSIYLITPHPLAWHLNYSADRLLYHLLPLIWLITCLNTRSIETKELQLEQVENNNNW
jgi:hypothetical protein